jgi:hypothetical protein
MRRRGRSSSAVLLALLAGAGGSLASCGLIVGDYVVGDAATDAPGDQANDVGGGGDAVGPDGMDTGGEDAMRDRADVTMTDGLADSANERGDAGADGDGAVGEEIPETGATDADGGSAEAEAGILCGQGIPTNAAFSDLVRTCVYVASCDPYLLPVSLSNCIGQNALLAAGNGGPLSCLSTIADCASYYDCQGIRAANGSTATECSGLASMCAGNVAYDCSGGLTGGVPTPWGTVTNCARIPGSSCQTFTDTNSNSRAGCVVVPSCTVPAGGGFQCSNNNLYECISTDGGSVGVGYGHSCGAAQCLAAGNSAACSFNGTGVCTSANGSTCNGTTLQQACSVPNQQFSYDCSLAGGTCVAGAAGSGGCVSPGCSLTSACAESCSGSIISTCVGGASYAVDCSSYPTSDAGSFRSCNNSTAGSPSWCVP